MPIFIPAGVVNPPPPKTATSVDGILTATAYEKGVYLEADFSDQVTINLVPDPSAEQNVVWNSQAGSSVERVESKPRTGDWSLRTINEGTRSVFRVEDVEAGREYTLSGWVYNPTSYFLPDGSFENGTDGWTAASLGEISQDTAHVHTGDYSLRVTTIEAGPQVHAYRGVDGPRAGGDLITARTWMYYPDLTPPLTAWTANTNYGELAVLPAPEGTPGGADDILEWTATVDQTTNANLFSSGRLPVNSTAQFDGSFYIRKGNTAAPNMMRMLLLCYGDSGYIGAANMPAVDNQNIPIQMDDWTFFEFLGVELPTGTIEVSFAVYGETTGQGNDYQTGDKVQVAAPLLTWHNNVRPRLRIGGPGVAAALSPDFRGPYNKWVQAEVTAEVTDPEAAANVYIYSSDHVGESIWFDDFEILINGSPIRGNGPTGVRMFGGSVESITDVRDQWVQVTATATAPETGTARFEILAPTGEGEYCWWDDVGITQGNKPVSFSGDTLDADGYQYSWTGTPHDSPSQRLRPSPIPADFNMKKVRFVRLPDQPVRSGNDAWAPWGEAIAFDMEAPLGRASTWIAYPIAKDGTVGEPSEGVTLHTAGLPEGCYDSRIVSTSQPELTREVMLTLDNVPEFSYQARNSLTPVQGSRYRAGGTDKHLAATATLTFFTEEAEDQTEMYDLLDSGVLLFQSLPGADLVDFYLLVGDFSMSLTDMGTAIPSRRWTVPITVVGRPSPFGAPLIIPGRSYDELAEDYATYDVLAQTFPSYHIMSRPSS